MTQPSRKLAISYKTKYALIFAQKLTLLGVRPEIKTYVHTKTCARLLIVAFFIMAPNWKQPVPFKETVTSTPPPILLSNTKEQTVDTHSNFYESQGNHAEWRRKANLWV